jgi:hypothetical protein
MTAIESGKARFPPKILSQVKPVMTTQRRNRVLAALLRAFLGGLALLPLAAGGMRLEAQSGAPATDVFASNGGSTAVYQDSFSSSCDETNHGSLAEDSPDPAVCFDEPAAPNGECSPVGGEDSTPAGQTGNICHYCQNKLPGNEIVVPNDSSGAAAAAYKQGYQCTANPADSCYLTCYGPGTFTPPPGTTLKAGTGKSGTPPPSSGSGSTQQPPSANPIKSPLLKGFVSNTDPCYPAGPKNYYVCDYPNLPRPPGCECSETPGPPQPGTQPRTQPSTQPAQQPATQPAPTGVPEFANETPDERTYFEGLLYGLSGCLQSVQNGLADLMTGAAYFAQGNFVQAAQTWDLQPGHSIVLQGIYTEMTTPQVGVNNTVSDFQRGLAGGKRLCTYLLIPAATKVIGPALKGGLGGKKIPSGTPSGIKPGPTSGPGGSPSQVPGGSRGAPPPRSSAPTGPGNAPPPRPSRTSPTGPSNGTPPPRPSGTSPTGPSNGTPPPRSTGTSPKAPNNGTPPPRPSGTSPTGSNRGAPPSRPSGTSPTGPSNGTPPPRSTGTSPKAPNNGTPPPRSSGTAPTGPRNVALPRPSSTAPKSPQSTPPPRPSSTVPKAPNDGSAPPGRAAPTNPDNGTPPPDKTLPTTPRSTPPPARTAPTNPDNGTPPSDKTLPTGPADAPPPTGA